MSEPAPTPLPAATIVLLRPRADGAEVLLIQRPATMAFGAGLHVFPGGKVDEDDAGPRLAEHSALSAHEAAIALGQNVARSEALALHVAALRELHEEAGVLLADLTAGSADAATLHDRLLRGAGFADALDGLDVRLATDRLAPIAHWTTPSFMPRRFSTWFFVADLPKGAVPVFAAEEVAAHRWVTPSRALDQVAAGEIQMWVPTTSVLQRLIETGATTAAQVAQRIKPGPVAPPRIVSEGPVEVRFAFGAVGGVPGRSGETTLIGARRLVLVDPGDASEAALGLIGEVVERRRAAIVAIVLSRTDPDHAAGAEALAVPHEIPILVAPGAGRHLPYATVEVGDGDPLPTDIDIRVRLGPPGSGRLEVAASAGE